MRGRSLLLCAGIVAVGGACGRSEGHPGLRKVNIRFSCDSDGGATVTVNPWRVVMLDRTDQIEWSLVPSGIDSVLIAPKNAAGWPFAAPPPVVVRSGKPGTARDVPAAVPAGTYKYNITGVCGRSGAPADTVVIDPDMIIPPI